VVATGDATSVDTGGGVIWSAAGSALGAPSGSNSSTPVLLLVQASIRDVGGLANQTFVKKLRVGFVASG
jgi:hypothetical protein